jgi:hypothetical protein
LRGINTLWWLWAAVAGSALGLLSPSPGRAGPAVGVELFPTSDRCLACHNALRAASGEDVSIGSSWRGSIMANSARDPYWQAAVRRETLDHPKAQAAIEDECSKCHMPMARFEAHTSARPGKIFANLPGPMTAAAPSREQRLAADGVACGICHQIRPDGLGTRRSFVGGFVVDTTRQWGTREVFGPFQVDPGRKRVMQSASRMSPSQAKHLDTAEFCASCHTLITHSLDAQGRPVGQLPEQVPYLEWQHSSYAPKQSCQSCHMVTEREPTAVSSVLGQPRPNFSRHVFRGGNFLVQRMLDLNAGTLALAATPQELAAAIGSTVSHLMQSSATLSVVCRPIQGGQLDVAVTVQSHAGHKLPTAYPSRRVWLHLRVVDRTGKTWFESGALGADGAIVGNDNDAAADRFEPHYQVIQSPDQVQIHEAILGAPDGAVTTGLLTATRYLKDNRILPQGFDAETAGAEIAVRGRAAADTSFRAGSDQVHYRVNVAGATGAVRVEVELVYQPIGYRWAHNLSLWLAPETNRFVRMYQGLARSSSVVLARAVTTAQRAAR